MASIQQPTAGLQYHRRVILLSRLFRALLAVSMTAYIHPDEHFQNTEVAFSLFYDSPRISRTWEWDPQRPCRSIVPVWLTTGWSVGLLSLFVQKPSARLLLVVERLSMLLLSLAAELGSEAIFKGGPEEVIASQFFDTSAIALVWLARPFSNSLSVLLLLPLMAIAKAAHAGLLSSWHVDLAWIMCCLGVWTRVDFTFYATPLMVFICWLRLQPESSWNAVRLWTSLRLHTTLLIVTVLIGIDTRFFAHQDRVWWQPVVSPLNSLIYNMSSNNLAEHGLHPRWLHILINAPLLFGVGLPYGVHAAYVLRKETIPRLCAIMLICGIGLLTLQPHQEPRFLLPCVVPFSVLLGRQQAISRPLWGLRHLWYLHTLLSIVFFGFLHQGGLLSALADVQRLLINRSDPASVVVWKTYMPPTHLTLPSSHIRHTLLDLAGADLHTLLQATVGRTILVAPIYQMEGPAAARWQLLSKHKWHLDPDHFDLTFARGLDTAAVGVYHNV